MAAETVEKKIEFASKYNTDLELDERREILQMIINAGVADNKIQGKGNGTQIRWKDIPSKVISSIYEFIQTKLAKKKEELETQ